MEHLIAFVEEVASARAGERVVLRVCVACEVVVLEGLGGVLDEVAVERADAGIAHAAGGGPLVAAV